MRKTGRNELCPCGSGKKYKKCCMNKPAQASELSMEQMSILIDKGFEHSLEKDHTGTCDIWLKVWDALKYKFKPEFKNLAFYDQQYKGSFFVSNFVRDLENELSNAGLADKIYFKKRINYCGEFLNHFPDEDESLIHNMRRAIAESYARLEDYEQAELEYKKVVQDYPGNPWSYIAWGDMYYDKGDYQKAKELYERALTMAFDDIDKMVVRERMDDLKMI